MKTTLIALCLLLCTAVPAQDAKPDPAAEPGEAKPGDAEAPPTSLGLQADFGDYIRSNYPGIDPSGEHDIFKLKNPTDPAKRHEYTLAMLKLIMVYIRAPLYLGPTLSKVFDQYSRGKEASQPVFKVLYAQLISNVPVGNPDNIARARKLLREAAEQAADYAFPWYILGELELATSKAGAEANFTDAFRFADNALRIKPDFAAAAAVKADLLCRARPPKKAEAVAVLTPLIEKPPVAVEDFEAVLQSYFLAAGLEKGVEATQALLKREDLAKSAKWRAKRVAALAFALTGGLDDALKWMEEALTEISLESDSAEHIEAVRFISDCWGMKATALMRADGTVAPENAKAFNEMFGEASRWFMKCVELESKHLPLDMRGPLAADYVIFLTKSGKHEDALLWLKKYLHDASLPAHYRAILELRRDYLETYLDPQETSMVKRFTILASNDQVEELALALAEAGRSLALRRQGFTTEEALRFFIAQLKSRSRQVVQYCAVLAADTARRREGKEAAETAKALADRLEEETECKNQEQSDLQQALCEGLRSLKQWTALARAVRHIRKLVDPETSISNDLGRVTGIFSGATMAAMVPGAPEPLGRGDSKNPKKLGPWLDDLAKAIDKQAAQDEAAKPAEKPGAGAPG